MTVLIMFLVHIASAADNGPVKDIQAKHNFLPSLESKAKKLMGEYGITSEKFVFLTPYTEDIKLENDFQVVFLDGVKVNGQELPRRTLFTYWNNDRDPLPPMVLLSPYSEPIKLKYADAVCSTLTISKKYISCKLDEQYNFSGGVVFPPASIAFPTIQVSQKPKLEYIWLTSKTKKIYGVQYKNREILKINGKNVKAGGDENTANLDWGGKSD